MTLPAKRDRKALIRIYLWGKPVPIFPHWNRDLFESHDGMLYPREKLDPLLHPELAESLAFELDRMECGLTERSPKDEIEQVLKEYVHE